MKLKSFKNALERSIEQWDWMSKEENREKWEYPKAILALHWCFLCEWHCQQGYFTLTSNGTKIDCRDCLALRIWGEYKTPYACEGTKSPYYKWMSTHTPKHAAKVRDVLIAALKRVEKESKEE